MAVFAFQVWQNASRRHMKLHGRGSLVRLFPCVMRMELTHEYSAGDPPDTAGVHQRMGQSGLELELEDNPNVMSMMVCVINYLFLYLGSPNLGRVTTTVHGANYCGAITAPSPPPPPTWDRPPHPGLRPLLFSNSALCGFFNFTHFIYLYRMFTLTAKAPFF